MKRLITICAIVSICTFTQTSCAQGILGSIFGGSNKSESNAANIGDILGNVISSVVGSVTTTQKNLVGDWTYTDPAVQFESNNLLTQAGGAAMATKCEKKLAGYYKIVGIKKGTLKFSFAQDNTCTYSIGKKTMQGTYVFDAKEKTVTITTATGQNVRAFVTVTGNKMSLCFDGDKVLSLFTTISSKLGGTLGTIGAFAGQYDGMKVGFKFGK